jgi:hypothetical protein
MWMSWIHLEDLVRAIQHAIHTTTLVGPVNALAPHPVTNAEFTRELGRILKRPAVLSAPAPVLRLLLGEMADELLLSSLRGRPSQLEGAGFQFRFPELAVALEDLLKR